MKYCIQINLGIPIQQHRNPFMSYRVLLSYFAIIRTTHKSIYPRREMMEHYVKHNSHGLLAASSMSSLYICLSL